MVRFVAIVVVLLLGGALFLNAQEHELTVTIDFRVFGVGNDSFEGIYFFDGKEYQLLEFHKVSRSIKVYSYRGSQEFRLFVKNKDYQASDPFLKEYFEVASLVVHSSMAEGLLVLHANPENRQFSPEERQYQLYLINDDKTHFVSNSILVVNATGRHLIGRIGKKDVFLKTGVSEPIFITKQPSSKNTRLAFALEYEGGVRLVMSNDVRFSNNRRVLLILMPPREKGSIQIAMRKLSQSIYEAIDE